MSTDADCFREAWKRMALHAWKSLSLPAKGYRIPARPLSWERGRRPFLERNVNAEGAVFRHVSLFLAISGSLWYSTASLPRLV